MGTELERPYLSYPFFYLLTLSFLHQLHLMIYFLGLMVFQVGSIHG